MLFAIAHFSLALSTSFFGYLPFGTVNLSVIHETLHKGTKAAFLLSLAASITEILHAYVAITFSQFISESLQANPFVQVAAFLLLVLLGIFFLLKKGKSEVAPVAASVKQGRQSVVKGMLLGLLNPQALPFWLLVVTFFNAKALIVLEGANLFIFLIGIVVGRLLSLLFYIKIALTLQRKVAKVGQYTNKIIGAIMLVLGCYQGLQLIA